MNKPNVLEVVFSSSWGGLEMLAGKFSASFKDAGFGVFCIHRKNEKLSEVLDRSRIEHRVIKPHLKYLDAVAAVKIAKFIKEREIDIIHCHISKDLSTLVLAKKLSGDVKLVFTQHMDTIYPKKDLFHSFVYANIDHIFTITDRMRKNQLDYTPARNDQVTRIYNGVEFNEYREDREFAKHFKQKLDIGTDELVVGTVGRIDRLKDQELLLQAAPDILRQFPNVKFLFVGSETDSVTGYGYRKHLEEIAAELTIESRVIFLSHTTQIDKIMSIFDIFVLTSRNESFGLVVIEAMAANKPVVGTFGGGVPEIIDDNKTGYLFPPGAADVLTEKIVSLLKDPEKRRKFGSEGRNRVCNLFDYNKNMAQYLQYFTEIAS